MPPQELRYQGRRKARRDRVHRGLLQPQEAALDLRVQGAGGDHGRVLRTHGAQVGDGADGGVGPRAFVSEILTQVRRSNGRGRSDVSGGGCDE